MGEYKYPLPECSTSKTKHPILNHNVSNWHFHSNSLYFTLCFDAIFQHEISFRVKLENITEFSINLKDEK